VTFTTEQTITKEKCKQTVKAFVIRLFNRSKRRLKPRCLQPFWAAASILAANVKYKHHIMQIPFFWLFSGLSISLVREIGLTYTLV